MPRGLRDLFDLLARYPALRGLGPEELARAVYLHDKYVLPEEVLTILGRGPDVSLKVSSAEDLARAVRVASGELSASALGLPARQFHYLRTTLAMERGREFSVDWQRNLDPYDDEIVPMQGGFLVDVSALGGIEVREELGVVRAGVGAPWTEVRAACAARGYSLDLHPIVPMDFTLGDLVGGAAPFACPSGRLEDAVRNVEVVLPDGRLASLGYDGVPANGSGYDLIGLFLRAGQHLAIPHTFTLTLGPRGATTRTLAYTFADAVGIAAALGRLAAARLPLYRVLLYDEVAWAASHPGEALGPVLEVALRAPEGLLPVYEKALDAALAGHAGKAEAASPLDAPPALYRRWAHGLRSAGILGEVLGRPADVANLFPHLLDLGPSTGVFGALQGSTVSLVPFSRRPLSRRERFDLLVKLQGEIRGMGRLAGPQLLLLLGRDEGLRRGFYLVRRVKERVDLPNTVNPSRAFLVPEVLPPPSAPRG